LHSNGTYCNTLCSSKGKERGTCTKGTKGSYCKKRGRPAEGSLCSFGEGGASAGASLVSFLNILGKCVSRQLSVRNHQGPPQLSAPRCGQSQLKKLECKQGRRCTDKSDSGTFLTKQKGAGRDSGAKVKALLYFSRIIVPFASIRLG